MDFRFIFILFLIIISTSCATKKLSSEVTQIDCHAERSIAADSCADLFNARARVQIIENQDSQRDRHALLTTTVRLFDQVAPKSIGEAFWKVVEQLAQNDDTQININTNQLVLTQKVTENLKIHSIYAYDSESNVFVLKKIDYTEKNRASRTLTDEPLYNQKIRDDLYIKINEIVDGYVDRNIAIASSIPNDVFKKLYGEQKHLQLFTTHELLKLSRLPLKERIAKYNFLLTGRRIRKFIVEDFMQSVIKTPLKTAIISVMSVAILSNLDALPNFKLISIKEETPAWVAPSVVKMAGRYSKAEQSEIIYLMKMINQNDRKSLELLEKDMQIKKSFVNIDMVDQFTIQHDTLNSNTYFILHHENEAGKLEIFALQINPDRFPNLARRAEAVLPKN
ncbi:MAG: hypothetical protein V4654_02390 [Bdellovibrionota bacterium]